MLPTPLPFPRVNETLGAPGQGQVDRLSRPLFHKHDASPRSLI